MEAKWPFMLIVFALLILLGLTIASIERSSVIKNWTTRRCDIPVAFTAAFFKPDTDSRSANDFAKENFEFCMKTYVDKFIALFMGPITTVFGKQVDSANSAMSSMNAIRNTTQTMYNTLATYLDKYFRKFTASVYEVNRIMQYLHMAVSRASAMAMSMVYAGITMFRGMINAFQVVIRVVLIICTIMLVIIIILWFILFPVIPLILGTLGAVISLVMALSMVMSSSLSSEASSKKGGFCFAEGTRIGEKHTPVQDIKVGDDLGLQCGKVTAVIRMEGNNIPLYNLNGIYVSGSHLVKGTDHVWKLVASDERAVKTDKTSTILYCFNTTSNMIPIVVTDQSQQHILFRDWEEIDNDDEK